MKKRGTPARPEPVALNRPGSIGDQIRHIEAAIAEAVEIGASTGLRFKSKQLRLRLLEAVAITESRNGEEKA